MTRKHLTPSEKATLLDIHADNEPALIDFATWIGILHGEEGEEDA